jgi:hypothetical protein
MVTFHSHHYENLRFHISIALAGQLNDHITYSVVWWAAGEYFYISEK